LVLTAQPFEKQFSTFSKTPKYKTIGCFDKTTGCFSLSLKNTFLLKGLRALMPWIQSRVDYILNLPQILSKRKHINNKHSQPSSSFKGFGFFKA